MKAYTDTEQSKMLAEILPLESADMRYTPFGDKNPWVWGGEVKLLEKDATPCWSLAALLGVLPVSCDNGHHCFSLINSNPDKIRWLCAYEDCHGELMMECYADNPVDACFEMIVGLNKHKLI